MIKPIVFISKCITFEPVRYSGQMVSSEFVDKLKPFIIPVTHCPEVEIGLGVPRDSIRIVVFEDKEKNFKQFKLIQPSTNIDLTFKMQEYSQNLLENIGQIDGFILKAKSPSCGIRDVKLYNEKNELIALNRKNPGIFGGILLKKFPNKIVEDEQRLIDSFLNDNFLKSIYLSANFRQISLNKKIQDLIKYHEKNKLLLMSYNQYNMRLLGKIVADAKKIGLEDSFKQYENLLGKTISRPYKKTELINCFEHAFGYFKDQLKSGEKKFFLDNLKDFSDSKVSQLAVITLLKSYIIRYEEKYLSNQTLFNPYPKELMY